MIPVEESGLVREPVLKAKLGDNTGDIILRSMIQKRGKRLFILFAMPHIIRWMHMDLPSPVRHSPPHLRSSTHAGSRYAVTKQTTDCNKTTQASDAFWIVFFVGMVEGGLTSMGAFWT